MPSSDPYSAENLGLRPVLPTEPSVELASSGLRDRDMRSINWGLGMTDADHAAVDTMRLEDLTAPSPLKRFAATLTNEDLDQIAEDKAIARAAEVDTDEEE